MLPRLAPLARPLGLDDWASGAAAGAVGTAEPLGRVTRPAGLCERAARFPSRVGNMAHGAQAPSRELSGISDSGCRVTAKSRCPPALDLRTWGTLWGPSSGRKLPAWRTKALVTIALCSCVGLYIHCSTSWVGTLNTTRHTRAGPSKRFPLESTSPPKVGEDEPSAVPRTP